MNIELTEDECLLAINALYRYASFCLDESHRMSQKTARKRDGLPYTHEEIRCAQRCSDRAFKLQKRFVEASPK